MKRMLLLVCAVLLVASLAFAGAPNTYQVTGPVLELKDDMIVVQKGSEKWEIARGHDRGQGREGEGTEEEVTPGHALSTP